MNRCQLARVHIALAASLCLPLAFSLAAPLAAQAQESVRREAPKDVVLARMTVVQPPVIQLDGRDDRLSPGARIHDTRNMLVLSASLAGQTVPMVYRRDAAGLVHEAWLLTADEYTKLSGASPASGEGVQQFAALLAAVFGARR